ncbi:MAG: efflux RND transporter periplasmic adaptor subunit [Oligoflexia bacterium]|nr:efflux RND transporter periplasmic adaptor subunit [Oligoflexia bacterium]
MKNSKIYIGIAVVILIAIGIWFFKAPKEAPLEQLEVKEGTFTLFVAAGGTIQPENKITITAPIAGRIDQILVEEGGAVRKGQIIAWMSSTDRAALMDSARAKGGEQIEDWQNVYKPTPIISPAKGTIISKNIVVGQTVTQQTSLFDLSDRLIVMADVDETDLGKISLGQKAEVRVDSYPNLIVETKVERIAHQSVVKNSINTYEVLLLAESLPAEFRAGLTAAIKFEYINKDKAVLLPTWVAEGRENFTQEVSIAGTDKKKEQRSVKFGLSNGEWVEVLEGLKPGENILIKKQNVFSENTPSTPFGVRVRGGRR